MTKKTTVFKNDVKICDSLTVKNNLAVCDKIIANDKNVELKKYTTIDKDANIFQSLGVGENLAVLGYANIGNNLKVFGSTNIKTDLSVSGNASLSSLTISPLSIQSKTIDPILSVNGPSQFSSDVIINGDLIVSSPSTFTFLPTSNEIPTQPNQLVTKSYVDSVAGSTGPTGPNGSLGPTGIDGSAGQTGFSGQTGPAGIIGPSGIGITGPAGSSSTGITTNIINQSVYGQTLKKNTVLFDSPVAIKTSDINPNIENIPQVTVPIINPASPQIHSNDNTAMVISVLTTQPMINIC